jgi:hypothetical protein
MSSRVPWRESECESSSVDRRQQQEWWKCKSKSIVKSRLLFIEQMNGGVQALLA